MRLSRDPHLSTIVPSRRHLISACIVLHSHGPERRREIYLPRRNLRSKLGSGRGELSTLLVQSASQLNSLVLLIFKVTINGSTEFSTQELFSFVEQDDALLGVLTVRETVAFAARLSLGSSYPGLDRHIDDTLRSLGLQDIAANKIGTPLQRGISGGQKRRVTIAQSIVTKPSILVLDEPTSGLDASSSREVVSFREFHYLVHTRVAGSH